MIVLQWDILVYNVNKSETEYMQVEPWKAGVNKQIQM